MKEKEEIPYSEPDLLLESLYFTEMFSWALVTKFTILIFFRIYHLSPLPTLQGFEFLGPLTIPLHFCLQAGQFFSKLISVC